MTPDWAAKPTTVPYASFGNPQTLNLYSYVHNNPLSFRDRDGHFEVVIGDAQKRYISDLQKASGLTIVADKNGKLSITKTPDKLSAVGRQIQRIIQDPNHQVHINAMADLPGTVVGSFHGDGDQTVNFKTVDQLSGKGGITETSAIVHETTEAYAGALNGGNYESAHKEGIQYENMQRLSEGLGARIGEDSIQTATGAHAEINFSFFREGFDVSPSGTVSNVTVQGTNGPEPPQ